jgi:septal ring factor EnvC (AmiA/AmiB activator)
MRAALALLLALAGPAAAETVDLAERLRAAAAALAEDGPDARRRAALDEAAAAQEAALAALRADLRAVATRRAALAATLAARDGAAFAALAALDRLGRAPPAAFLAHPAGPLAAARAASALAVAAPEVERAAATARAALDGLRGAEAAREAALAALRAAAGDLHATRAEIENLLDRRSGAPSDLAAAVEAVAGRGRAAADALEAAPGAAATAAEAAAAFAAAKGALPPPVEGRVAARFGAAGPRGARTGLELAAPAWSLARAPWTSTLRYAGPIGDRGLVAILEPAPGALLLLGGLVRVDRGVGETIMTGEPVGAIGGPPPESAEFLVEASGGRETPEENLYIELRIGGEPTDPEPWFAFPAQDPEQGTDG